MGGTSDPTNSALFYQLDLGSKLDKTGYEVVVLKKNSLINGINRTDIV